MCARIRLHLCMAKHLKKGHSKSFHVSSQLIFHGGVRALTIETIVALPTVSVPPQQNSQPITAIDTKRTGFRQF